MIGRSSLNDAILNSVCVWSLGPFTDTTAVTPASSYSRDTDR